MLLFRNLGFYLTFYLLSTFYILWAVSVMHFSVPMFRRAVRCWCNFHRWCLRVFVGINVETEGDKAEGAVFYAIKHESFFEALDAPANFHWPAPFAKQELFRIPFWGWGARIYGCVPVAREQGAKALRSMISAAKTLSAMDRPLVIFPEGTRIPHGERGELQAGFAGLYKLIKLPVIPVAVNSGPLYHRLLKRPGTITYKFGDPIPPGLPREEIEARVLAAINVLND
ncbi:lysophospholipid acyltransferase family protein [Pontixanthobacter aestiaquae]|uniref:1-acyl-sn-glycerol-3-phosphate acyltransferase n=1 Tax=Pontixanthobacter aestiaquae TaxID=1509367 RepID=A0A844Z9B8_9SPHN|nr:lysophospholipid acyltransferase family protein [Pontixanthobacter aestiaquae]MDN3644585.1 lysophospholipid acyltransferase family protein [Pontixanthobacter aestiaquae]MXO84408.1 1-acyl-sn-glycerol-3-phosphate acyltransferase [Pontixanthobacter aestiaquae]